MIEPRPRGAAPVVLVVLVILVALSGLVGCATNPVTGEQDFVLMSEQEEIELGEKYDKQVRKQYDVYDDKALQNYVSNIGQRLAAKSHRPGLDYHFTVLDSTQVNAFALPGGYVYITRGIMAYFNSEAELAGVLGHELGHVTARHSVRQYSANAASSILGGILLTAADAGQAAGSLYQTVQKAALSGYSRDQELQADRLGAQYLARAGYDSREMMDVIRILSDQEDYERKKAKEEGREPNTYHGVFASHPENDARLQEVIQAARKYEVDDPRPDGHAEYLRQLAGMTFGPGASQGAVADHQFLHLELDTALEAPHDWTIDNQPQQVLFRAPDDAALVQVTLGKAEDGADPRELLSKRIGANDLSEGRRFDAAGESGYTAVARAKTPYGQRPVRFIVVIRGGRAWYFAGTNKDANAFDEFDQDYLDIAGSMHDLTAAERRKAQPTHIRLIEAKAGTRYKALARSVEGVEDATARLRLLNGDWPDDEPKAGRLIKTLER